MKNEELDLNNLYTKPKKIKLQADVTGISKLNKKGIIIVAGVLLMVGFIMISIFSDNQNEQQEIGSSADIKPEFAKDAMWYANVADNINLDVSLPNVLKNENNNIEKMPDLDGKAQNITESITVGKQDSSANFQVDNTANNQSIEQIKQQHAQLSQAAYNAGLSATGFENLELSNLNSANNANLPVLANNPNMPHPLSLATNKDDDPNKQMRKEQFFKDASNSQLSEYNNSEKNPPLYQNEIKAGSIIPAVMLSAINSDIPGQIVAQVREDVYDTKTGKKVLIPAGARLIGNYDSQVAYGQTGLPVAWLRILYPDGSSYNLRGMPGSDQMGMSGFRDQVNNHYLKIFGSSFVLGLISGGIMLSQPEENNANANSARSTMSAALVQQIGQTALTMTQKNLNIAPTLQIRTGYKFNIMIMADLVIPPYEKN